MFSNVNDSNGFTGAEEVHAGTGDSKWGFRSMVEGMHMVSFSVLLVSSF